MAFRSKAGVRALIAFSLAALSMSAPLAQRPALAESPETRVPPGFTMERTGGERDFD